MSESNCTSFSDLSSSDSSSSDEQPSTKQGKPSKVGRKTLKPKCLAKSKTKGGKGKLSEDEIVDICDKIKNEQSRLQTSTRDKVLSIFKQSISGLANILCGTDYEHLVGIIVEDFISVYKEKVTVSSKYESFQITMFTKQRDYLYVAGAKQDLAKTVFQHVTDIYRVFPVLYQAVCDSIQCLIVELVDNKADKGDKKELLEEEDSQLYRMHGWVLYELVKKSEYKDTVKQFKLGDKSELPQAIKFLDVGTKVGLTFPKSEFMPFMRACDRFIRQCTTNTQYEIYGKNIIKVAKTLVLSNLELQKEFHTAMMSCCSCDQELAHNIYTEWIEKLMNMKMKGRFMDAMDRLDNDASKKLTSKTQNLRNKLLTHHVKE